MHVDDAIVIEENRLDESLDLTASRYALVEGGDVDHRRILKKGMIHGRNNIAKSNN